MANIQGLGFKDRDGFFGAALRIHFYPPKLWVGDFGLGDSLAGRKGLRKES
jgi:hypothetical protein